MPATINAADASAVELGVRFTSDVAGTITGIRFYKGPQNTGTHTGELWSATGTKLATATFSSESTVGLAAGQLHHAGLDHRQDHLRRLVPHQRRATTR